MVIFALFVSLFFWFTSAQNVWKTNGPYGEQVTSLALDPSDSLLIYAGTGDVRMVSPKGSGNGVYRTTDGGKTWEHTSLDSVFIWDIEIDSRSNVYAATRGYGVFKSTDKGETWHPINNGLGCLCISCVVIDPLNDSILYVGTGDRYVSDLTGYCKDGIYKSMDGGQSWSQLAFDDMVIGAIAIDPTSPEIIYAGVYGDQDTSGIYKSVDGGQTWQKKYADTWASAIVIDPANTNIVYADGCGLIKSTDGGETWAGCGVGAGEIWTIAVDPLDPNIVYAGNAAYPTMDERFGGFYRSIDGGKTFSEAMIGMPHQPIYSIVVDSKNSKVYVGNDGPGVFMSIDKGKTWQWLSNRMTLQRVMGLTINPRDGTVLATTWSWGAHAAVYKSTDFGDSWFNSSTGIYQTATVCIAVAPSAPDTVYLVTRTAGRCPLYRSFDSGTSWQECDRLWSPTTDIAVNPLNAKEFYLACGVL
ncbi:MAG TPA: hypothetical protein EYP60_02145, partial [bacterium (Candidatus Stahlbacteria)]|nr:hypothetical protein [Candidatus Stahlbacteria bacterium]